MTDLITISNTTINNELVQTVNARDLHEFLESKRQFSDWIKDNIENYCFVENCDFVTFSQNGEKGRPRIEYALDLNMAKELAMVERNEKGKQARRYFIECERRAKQPSHIPATASAAFELIPKIMQAALAFGFDNNVAAISANQAVIKLTGIDALDLLGQKHLLAPDQESKYFTPTEIGSKIGLSARAVNILLLTKGLQTKIGKIWQPTPAANGLYRLLDTGKRHRSGVSVQQLKWSEKVAAIVSN